MKKATQNIAQEQNPDLQDEYMHEISTLRSDQLVFIDETGVDKALEQNATAGLLEGGDPVKSSGFIVVGDPRYFRLILKMELYISECTRDQLIPKYSRALSRSCFHIAPKWPNPKSVLIMDNASFHHSERIQQLCDDAGVVLRYLPPYSPHVNPIEEFFGELRTYIRQIWDEHDDFIRADFMSFLEECVTVVGNRKASAKGHFRHAGISIDYT